ncbi:MAG: radical SAM protein [Nitrospirota bacterium]|nr:radical SAM protein [Nitrospirota bacterium]
MKVLFLNPPMGNWVTWGKHITINPHLAQVAAYVRENTPLEVVALDARVDEMDADRTLEAIAKERPDVVYQGNVVVTAGGAATVARTNAMFQKIKARFPGILTVGGGLMYSAIPVEALQKVPSIDFLTVGETEETLAELLEALLKGSQGFGAIRGLAWREDGEVRLNAPRPLIRDLDTLPMPAYDLFPMERYRGFSTLEHFSEALTSRGCMGGCGFCYEWWLYDPRRPEDFLSYRSRSGKKVAEELELLSKEYGIRTVNFLDDDFNASREKIVELSQELIRRNIKIDWFFMGRAGNFVRDMDLVSLMKQAGCYFVLMGIEGSQDEERFRMLKGTSFEQIRQAVQAFRAHDIGTVGTFMVGFWEDDEEAIKRRVETMDMVDPDVAALQVLTPVPGSPVYKKAMANGLIEVTDWELWDIQHAIMPTKHLTRERLRELAAWAQAEFFKKPERIERLMNAKHPCIKASSATYMENAARFARDKAYV